jgi:outer membrane lipoprotein SlyB
MVKTFTVLALMAVLSAAGCASQAEFLNNNQFSATQTAVSRAQFEMNCQQVTPTIISREVVQPALQGPWVNGIQRAEYTVGVAGCGKRTTYVVICPQYGDGCFAAGPGRFHPDWQ